MSLESTGDAIGDVEHLEDLLSEPDEGTIEILRGLSGDLILLGVGGKMGPTLACMARRASDTAGVQRRVLGVSRFAGGGARAELEARNIETIACDLLDAEDVARLPQVENVIFMAGKKFGTSGSPSATWAMNVVAPAFVTRHFKNSRIVAFSTGNVYGLVPSNSRGSKESDALRPVGEYAMSAVGRERVFEDACDRFRCPTAILRLNYAVETRYGVLHDLAQQVWLERSIDLSMGHVNVIWQGDANAATLKAFDHVEVPARVMNLSGEEILRVRDICEEFGDILGKKPRFVGEEASDALLNDGTEGRRRFGEPRVSISRVLRWVANWIRDGRETHGLPTHFESRDGAF